MAIKCEICGCGELIKQDGVFACQNCGTKYSVEEVRKMAGNNDSSFTPSPATVKVDTSDELRNLYELARRAKMSDNTTNAKRFYEQILVKDPSSWEANFYTVYYQSKDCKIGEIGLAAVNLTNALRLVFELIRDNLNSEDEKRAAVSEVASKLIDIATMLFASYKSFYDGIDYSIKNNYVQEYASNCAACRDILYKGGDTILSTFGESYGLICIDLWKLGVGQHNILNGVFKDKQLNANIIDEYNRKIYRFDNTYMPQQINMKQDGGCYVATCVYGSYDCPEVWTLRRYRDNTLASHWYGRAFIKTYYAVSPAIVRWFGDTKWFKRMWKGRLDRMVKNLWFEGVESTPYEDKRW